MTLPATPAAAWIRWTIAYSGWAKKGSISARRPLARSRPASRLAARRSESVPGPRSRKEQSSRIRSIRPAESTGGGLSLCGGCPAEGWPGFYRCRCAGVAEWQTRGTQNAVSFGTCGFDSHLRHLLYARRMCGRYTLTDPDPRLMRFRFGLLESAEVEVEPTYNVAPTDPVLALRL